MKSIVQVVQNLLKPYIDSNIQTLSSALTTQENNITDIYRTGTTNTGSLILKEKYFYLDGVLKIAITDISQGATFTSSNCMSGAIGERLQSNNSGQMVGFHAEYTLNTSDLSNVSQGEIKIKNRNGVVTIIAENIVCTPDTVVKNISGYIGSGKYYYDNNGGSAMQIDNSQLYFKTANVGYRILTIVI